MHINDYTMRNNQIFRFSSRVIARDTGRVMGLLKIRGSSRVGSGSGGGDGGDGNVTGRVGSGGFPM